jgi:hypothetical protein
LKWTSWQKRFPQDDGFLDRDGFPVLHHMVDAERRPLVADLRLGDELERSTDVIEEGKGGIDRPGLNRERPCHIGKPAPRLEQRLLCAIGLIEKHRARPSMVAVENSGRFRKRALAGWH